MKKVKLYPTLVLSFILSLFSVATAALEHTTTYGTPPSPFGIDASLKQVTLPSSPGMAGASVGRSPEQIAAIEKQVAADKAAYCKANNYPTKVPFCAGFKKQEIQKQCADEKGRIESENSGRLSGIARDNQREIGRCNSQSTTGWSGNASGGHPFLMFGVAYTVENPTYDKCVNAVSAAFETSKADAQDIYTRDQNTARSAMNAQCANFY